MPHQTDNMEELNAALKEAGDKLVVVAITADWCGPCQKMSPLFLEIADDPDNSEIVFLRVDVDKARDVTDHYKINILPSFLFYRKQALIVEFSGVNEELLKTTLEELR